MNAIPGLINPTPKELNAHKATGKFVRSEQIAKAMNYIMLFFIFGIPLLLIVLFVLLIIHYLFPNFQPQANWQALYDIMIGVAGGSSAFLFGWFGKMLESKN